MPHFDRFRNDFLKFSVSRCHPGARILIVSITSRLSTTLQRNPAASISACRRLISSTGHTSPAGTSYKAVTIPSAPASRASRSVTRSFGPNQRQVCSIVLPHTCTQTAANTIRAVATVAEHLALLLLQGTPESFCFSVRNNVIILVGANPVESRELTYVGIVL